MLQTVIFLYRFEQSRAAQTLEVAVSVPFLIISGAFQNNLQSESAQTSSNPSESNQIQLILPKRCSKSNHIN